MSTQTAFQEQGAERQMGHVYATITIRNRADEIRLLDGSIRPSAVRSLTLERVLVDTGASTLALPAPMIAELGLEFDREVPIQTANGTSQARLYRDASLTVEGRRGDFRCLELSADAQPLLGVLPMEELGIEPDVKNHTLRLLPEEPGGATHFLLM